MAGGQVSSYNGHVRITETSRRELLALRPASLFDGISARLLAEPTVLVEDGRITAVDVGGIDLSDRTTVVDLPGCTLLPGLIDTHVHLSFDASCDPTAALQARDDSAALAAMADAARQQLRAGVTTVRDLGDRDYLALRLRDSSAGSHLPTIVAAGPPLTTPGGHCHFLGGVTPPGLADVRAAVAEHAERGVDVVKVMASGGFLTPSSAPEAPQYGAEELRAIVDESHRHGLPVTAHAHSQSAIVAALDAGVDGIEHCSFLTPNGVDAPDELIDRIASRRTVVGATVGFLPGSSPPPFIAAILPAILAVHARLHEAGAPIVAGTDAGIAPIKPHGVLAHAAGHLVDLGFTAHEALRAVTVDAARVCGLGDRKGRIAPGYDADLLAVDGNPLTDPTALTRVAAVYRDGQPVSLTSKETD